MRWASRRRVGSRSAERRRQKNAISKNKQARANACGANGVPRILEPKREKKDQHAKPPKQVQRRERAKQEREAKRLLSQQKRERRKENKKSSEHEGNASERSDKREKEQKRERRLRAREEREQERLRRLRWHEEIQARARTPLGTQARTDGELGFYCSGETIGCVHDIRTWTRLSCPFPSRLSSKPTREKGLVHGT